MTNVNEPHTAIAKDVEHAKRVTAFLETSLARHLTWIAAADAKTAVIFTVAIAMVGLPAATAPKYGQWTPLGAVSAIIAGMLLLAALGLLTLAIVPRTKPPAPSIIFFGGVATRSIDDYRRDVLVLTDESYVEDLVQQTHVNATIAAKKYYWIKRAAILLYVSVIPWVTAIYMLFRDRN